jgi:hypothetical protein
VLIRSLVEQIRQLALLPAFTIHPRSILFRVHAHPKDQLRETKIPALAIKLHARNSPVGQTPSIESPACATRNPENGGYRSCLPSAKLQPFLRHPAPVRPGQADQPSAINCAIASE